MTWVDLAIIGVLISSAGLAFARGFTREVLGLGTYVAAGAVAVWALPFAHDKLNPLLPTHPEFVNPIAFGVVFIVAVLVLYMITSWLVSLVRMSAIGKFDRTLGFLFGLARGAIVLVVAYIVVGMVVPIDKWPEPVLRARLMPYIYRGAVAAVPLMPVNWRPLIDSLPAYGDDPTSVDALLHPQAQGRAITAGGQNAGGHGGAR